MAIVCNAIVPQLVVTMPGNCAQFTENTQNPGSCGAGTSSDFCTLNISGGNPPYTTAFSYPQTPATVFNCTLNMGAFTGGSGFNPQFGYAFTGPDMCQLTIRGLLRVNYTVTDSSGQVVTGSGEFAVDVNREVTTFGGCDCTSYGPDCYEFMGGCQCPRETDIRPCYL